MGKNNDCKIIQDLLPNYMENLTLSTTNGFIEEHLKECQECNSIFENMKKDFEKENNNIEKEINYAKKYNSRFKKMKYTLMIVIYSLILIILVFFGRNFIIFKNLANKIESYEKADNYYIREYSYQGWTSDISETWVKDESMLCKYNNNVTVSVQNGIIYNIFNNEYTASNCTDDTLSNNWNFIDILKDELNSPKSIFKYSVKEKVVNGKECYQLTNKNTILYFEKDTGLLVRYEELEGFVTPSQNEIQSTVYDYKFIFNEVTDEYIEINLAELKEVE
jgi:hypothetical protein